MIYISSSFNIFERFSWFSGNCWYSLSSFSWPKFCTLDCLESAGTSRRNSNQNAFLMGGFPSSVWGPNWRMLGDDEEWKKPKWLSRQKRVLKAITSWTIWSSLKSRNDWKRWKEELRKSGMFQWFGKLSKVWFAVSMRHVVELLCLPLCGVLRTTVFCANFTVFVCWCREASTTPSSFR